MSATTWKLLHNLPHVDHTFSAVDNDFVCPSDIDEIWSWNISSYQQSIQMFAFVPIGIFMIYLLLMTCLTLCCRCRKRSRSLSRQRAPSNDNRYSINSGGDNFNAQLLADNSVHRVDSDPEAENGVYGVLDHRRLTMCAKLSRIALSVVSICIILCALYVGYRLDRTVADVQTSWDASYEPYDECVAYGSTIELLLTSALTQCDNINAHVASDCQSTVQPIIASIEPDLRQSLHTMQTYLDDASKVSWGSSADIDRYRKYLIYAGIVILSLIAVMVAMSTLCVRAWATLKRCVCCHTLLAMALSVAMFVSWTVASYQFALSVQVSDACADPPNAILQGVNLTVADSSIGGEHLSASTLEIVEYYVYCDAQQYAYNPLLNYTRNAYAQLVALNATVYGLAPYAEDCNVQNESAILLRDYNHSLTQLVGVIDALQCERIHASLTSVTNDMCVDGIQWWFLFYAAQCLVILLLVLRGYCVCTTKVEQFRVGEANHNHYNVVVDNDDAASEHSDDRDAIIADARRSRAVSRPSFNDNDVRKCIKFLLPFMDNETVLDQKAQSLQRSGFNRSGQPLNAELVRRALSIVKNYKANSDSHFVHPLLKDLV
eukprot:CAMPEP_0202729194 /NCGR_PEP_ID=MMETSP1385-20130828/186008_1 /ASSEMBLY_ACC=CAM_ASM_000861 /TAXON_ID=933848 /ORGANISM="Elphidium margaritaceum" /LENGTH=602 /DNA_ID=CAMNT_0049395451 /DNA_START=22 /DNA_END=1830 /DNA_ORIENTATION=+